MNYKELFIDKDDVLIIRKELVRILGDLNEAVILNQLNYWIEINKKANKNLYDGKYWVYNTYQTWRDTDFDFWSTDTIKRTMTRLQNKGIVLTGNYNKLKIDKTKWYTIDYVKLQSKVDEYSKKQSATMERADCVHDWANCTVGQGNMHLAIPETTTENTNKDYNAEINTDALKDKSFKGGMDASSRGEKVVGRSRSYDKGISKTEYTQDQLESYLPNKIRELYGQEALALDEYADELVKIVMYFYRRYKYYRKENHPILSDISYRKIVLAFLEPPETIMEYGDFSFESYKVMIDKYFATDFGKYSGAPENFNYRLSHFMSDNIREHIYLQTCI